MMPAGNSEATSLLQLMAKALQASPHNYSKSHCYGKAAYHLITTEPDKIFINFASSL